MALANVLRALADLAPSGPAGAAADVLVDLTDRGAAPFAWLGDDLSPAQVFDDETASERGWAVLPFKREDLDHLRSIDALNRERQRLRAGWLWLCGPVRSGPSPRRVCLPLLRRPVRLDGRLLQLVLQPAGDTELGVPVPPDVELPPPWFGMEVYGEAEETAVGADDRGANDGGSLLGRLVGGPVLPEFRRPAAEVAADRRTGAWATRVLAAAGIEAAGSIVAGVAGVDGLARWRDGDELVLVVGTGLYLAAEESTGTSRATLEAWAEIGGLDRTALAHVYGLVGAGSEARVSASTGVVGDPPEPLPLTAAQADVVARSRVEPVVVVSGAPGNGKSHAVCAVAVDAVARGRSVLVATPSPYAAEVLGELLARQPGPTPVLFGEAGGRRRMVADVEAMAEQTVDGRQLGGVRADLRRARAAREAAEVVVVGALERDRRADEVSRWATELPDLRAAVPGVFTSGADLDEVRARIAALRERDGWWRRRRLRRLVGGAPIVGIDAIADAVEAAAAIRAELELDRVGGTAIGPAWDALLAAEDAERAAEGRYVDALARSEDRWRQGGRRAVAALLAALPAGRHARRHRLAEIDADDLVRALPLWVGTLRDAEDLLPRRPGLFDLVVVDEAVQVDQFRATGALLRARRAVVVGDPRQLRHVSFVADAEVRSTLERHGIGALADRLDVRRQSIYDVAAGAAPVTFLDEHFRSVPHLIEFSSRRFYDGRVRVATRHPTNETEDAIDVATAPDVAGEVGVAVDIVAARIAAGQVGIGVYTPFRAHADAIEAAILERFEPEVIEAHGIRAGTAHSSQGSEREEVLVVLGLKADDPPARWRFAEDPNLFNVLVTRARRRLTVVTSLLPTELPRGIVRDYLRHAADPPAPPSPASVEGGRASAAAGWTAALAAELERNGVPTRVGYPVGRWTVDVCAGVGDAAVALDCGVHPDGTDAHLARHRALRRAGWRVVDAFASRWDGDAAAAAVELATGFRADTGHP